MASIVRRSLSRHKLMLMLVLFGLLLSVLLLMSDATENSAQFSELYSWLLVCSAFGLLGLMALIGNNLYHLARQYRLHAPGARLTLRLVILFVVIAMAPVTIVFYFSLQFLQQGIDSWFDVRVENALEDALALSQSTLDLHMREIQKQAAQIAEELAADDDGMAALKIGRMLKNSEATEITLFSQNGRIVATANADPSVIVPNRPPSEVLMQVQQGHHYVSLDPVYGSSFHIRAVVRLLGRDMAGEDRILQVLYPVATRIGQLGKSVQSAFENYKKLVFLRTPLKASFILTLSLALLLGILAALWTAVYAARRLVAPVRDLAEGTQAVAAGQYDRQVLRSSNDELGFLVDSFNQMTRSLTQARDTAQRSQRLVERQRAYLETVLARLSSGVLTLDHDGRLRTCNNAAGQILETDLNAFIGHSMIAETEHETVRQFFDLIGAHLSGRAGDWRQEIALFGSGGRRVLMCRGSSLVDPISLDSGYVIVFDDITALVQAERDAAWGEVARRLAHEIKNPLTPIQLAAERMRHKFLKTMDASQVHILERSTHTIIQQVQAMKDMVNDFNEFARAPKLNMVPVFLNDFITEVLYLYRDYPVGVEIKMDLDSTQPIIEADKGRLRQLLHNVVKNAIEAMKDGEDSVLVIGTRCDRQTDMEYTELSFQDNGPGFPESNMGNIFEPYVTSKAKGTGLGLAIVKKIVEEHGGVIRAESPPEGGARIVIRFPVSVSSMEADRTKPVNLFPIQEAG